MNDKELKELLDSESERINCPAFIQSDPVQFPRRFTELHDIELTAFLAASIAWGKRSMICRDAERLLALTDNRPYDYVMDEGYEDLDPELNIHRTLFAGGLQHFMRGMRRIYKRYGSLDDFCKACGASVSEAPAWHLVGAMQEEMLAANDGEICNKVLPFNMKTTALKRVNMALRWLVRDDGIVDMGVWKSLDKSQLYIPLDVHVGNVARELGLLTRKADDRKSVELLTSRLRDFRRDDPVVYDYALFGIGVGV